MNSVRNTISPGLNILRTGGQPSLMQKVSGFMTWQTIAIIIVVLLLCVFAYYTYNQYVDAKTAFQANRENIPKDANSNKTATLMLFYVDWCPHCKTAKPEWESLKSEYDGKNINGYTITFVEYNCTKETPENQSLMDKYKIEGFPSIILNKDNQIIDFDAKPSKATMEQFLNTVL